MNAGRRLINDIFNGFKILEIPFFQRAYVWGEEQWERLLDDLTDVCQTKKTHFFGSVILKQRTTPADGQVGDRRRVIDGQQRLTTLMIFFKVLCLKTENKKVFNKFFRLLNDEIALTHNHNDIDAFGRVMNKTDLELIDGKDAVTKCFNYFTENINEKKLDMDTILQKVLFVGIDLDENEDEQQIFDRINSLGVKLTTAELLKNYFFNKDNVKMYENYWKNIFESDDETKEYWDIEITTGRLKRTFIDLLLFAYLQIKVNSKELNVKTEDKIDFGRVEQLFQSYKAFIKNYMNGDTITILNELREYAILFRNTFNRDIIDDDLPAESGTERINALIFGMDNTPLITYILFVLKENKDKNKTDELFEYIESFICRRLIVRAINKNYNQMFTDRLILNDIKTKEGFINYLKTQDDKTNYMPNDGDLQKGFHDSILSNKIAASILYMMESKIRRITFHSTKLLGISKYSLEHLMPKKWENNWGKLDNQSDIERRNRKLLTLGNLAIITQNLNAKIRDSNWETKKNGTKNDGLFVYAGNLETIAKYLNFPEWNESTIEQRANELYNYAVEIWKV